MQNIFENLTQQKARENVMAPEKKQGFSKNNGLFIHAITSSEMSVVRLNTQNSLRLISLLLLLLIDSYLFLHDKESK